jgi:hypothetical protein
MQKFMPILVPNRDISFVIDAIIGAGRDAITPEKRP